MIQPETIDAHLSFIFYRSHLKKVFSPNIGVEPSSQVLDILEYACGLILGLVLISTENPNFEEASDFRKKFSMPTAKPPPYIDYCHPPAFVG
jgi:hypothetical protein